MGSLDSSLDSLVFDAQSLNEEITFLRGVSGSFTDVLLLTGSTWNERGHDQEV